MNRSATSSTNGRRGCCSRITTRAGSSRSPASASCRRVAAARFLEERIDGRELHVVLAADLDADPPSSSARFWTGRQSLDGTSVCYRDAWECVHPDEPGHTFGVLENPLGVDWDWPFRRIDYIFVRCGEHGGPTLRITRCERILDQPINGVWASDHFGVVADLVLPEWP